MAGKILHIRSRDLIVVLVGVGFAVLAIFALGLPIYALLAGVVLVMLGLGFILSSKGFLGSWPKGSKAEASMDPAHEVLIRADRALAELAASVEHVRNPTVQECLLHLHLIASDVMVEVERAPKRLAQIQPLLAHYLPAASRLARDYVALESKPDLRSDYLAQATAMITRLDKVFDDYAKQMVMPEAQDLDMALQSLDKVLREDKLNQA